MTAPRFLNAAVAAYAAAGALGMAWALCLGLSGAFSADAHTHAAWSAADIAAASTWIMATIYTTVRAAWRA